jgi:epoxyqueuosine reductase QueG
MKTLNSQIKDGLIGNGASLVSFADLKDLPVEVTNGLPRAVSIAVTLNPAVVRGISNGPTKEYFAEYERVNNLLGELCERVVKIITKAGKRAEAITTTTEHYDTSSMSVLLQHKTIATRAGLGWIGKSALLITKKYGAAIRLGSVLTNAELETANPVNDSHCGACNNCVEACPAKAITGRNWELGLERGAIYDAFACCDTAQKLSRRFSLLPNLVICGICINVCPWTQKYISSDLTS